MRHANTCKDQDHWFAPSRRDEFRVRFADDVEGFAALSGGLVVALLVVALLGVTSWVGATGRDDP